MNKVESREFVMEMEKSGDFWSEEQVEDIYGKQTLAEALQDRKKQVREFMKLMNEKLCEN